MGGSFLVDAMADMHVHLREGEDVMCDLATHSIEGGADVVLPMPNTQKGLLCAKDVLDYHVKLVQLPCLPGGKFISFVPTVMINESTTTEVIDECADNGIFDAKVYPLNRTTKSHNGVYSYARIMDAIRRCGEKGVRVHFHPENPWMLFDGRDAEYAFLQIAKDAVYETKAIVIWEHGTDARCIPFWREMAKSGRFCVTLTPHHLVTNEDSEFGDVRSVCKPPIKTRRDQKELVQLVLEDNLWVMAGTDTAPHPNATKHPLSNGCSCGSFQAPFAVQLYAHALLGNDEIMDLEMFNNFISRNARHIYTLPPASRQVKLKNEPFKIPLSYKAGSWEVESFWAGKTIDYSLVE